MGLKLFGEVSLDAKGFEQGLKRLGSSAVTPLRNMLIGAFSIAALERLTRSTVEWAGQLRDVADQLGVNVEWLQKMQNGAKLAGGSIEDLSKFIGQIGKSREEAARSPGGKDAAAFRRLGLTAGDITQLSPQAFIDKLVKAFSNGVTGQSANDLQAVGGKSARNLVAAFANQFQSDAPILAEDMIDQLDEVGDRFSELATLLKFTLAPAILFVMDKIRSALATFGLSPKERLNVIRAKVMIEDFGKDPDKVLRRLSETERTALSKMMGTDTQKAREAEREGRRQREGSAPGFEALDFKPVKTGRQSDALVSVGNFLGSTGGGIQAIEQRKIDLLQQIANATKITATLVRNLGGSSSFLDGLQFPI